MAKKLSSQQVRIIAGLWKRTPITVIDAPGLRPTPDRVRETVFNWLTFLFQGNWQAICCLDLYAGSGAMGFEAGSRGAQQVTLVEIYPPAVQQLEKIKAKLQAQQVQIIKGDAMVCAKQLKGNLFDVIFLDPPFNHNLLEEILPICTELVRPTGYLYIESEKSLLATELPAYLSHWEVIRSDRAGKVHFNLLQRNN